MREKYSSISGRAETLDVLTKECSYNLMKDLQGNGASEISENLAEMVKDEMRKELENVLKNFKI